ncbi:protein ELYS homolog [Lucilia sericata]|uniref:protein ELYS homolog n=1 Tax=Lucilia sericata TaxID=13632 RepID=UPI0018A85867|nr:protein ELYS homolog [Lucilia sericata]
MEWHDIEVDGRHTVKFTDLPYVPLTSPPQSPDAEELFIGQKIGGIIRHGEWAWLARNSVLQIVSLRNGQTISSYEFCESRGYESCCIKCVEEVFPNNPEYMMLAVVLESFRGPGGGGSFVALYSVELSSVLSCIELSLHITCSRFMDSSACRRSLLQNFDGCLAVGSEEGVIVLLDLNMQKIMSLQNELQEDKFVPCHIVDYSLSLTEIHRNFRQCQQDGIHFGLQMEVIESPCAIQCILPIDLILGLAIGLEDGRLALYDLAELQIFYVALPTPEVTMSALVKMDFLEPPDDPRPCLYIWTLHENGENLHAVLHSLMYEKRLMEEDESTTYFESFQTSTVRLQLPLEATKSVALACQAISTLSSHGEDDSNCLCAISWLSVLEGKNKLLIFDLNQWYKEEMPFVLEYGKHPNYLAGYILNGECTGLHALLNPNNIAHFNSMQRFEEHFYPNSLSFEGSLLHTEGCRRYNWEGAQNRVINLLRSSNAAIFLEPNFYFNEILRTRLMPQFTDLNLNSTFSRHAKYEILLSAALEHNCVSLLRDCAKSWIDGSFMGNFSTSTGLSLSTITDWIWKRATAIKARCNDLCKSLFEFGGYPLDSREQKELGFITRQLKLLSDLLKYVLVYAKKQIPERVYSDLENKHSSLSMASSYQDILLWLLNIGLLPEASPHNDKINAGNDLVPYPYTELKELYRNKRSYFAKINESFISKKSGSCKLLFIDSFIEHVCKGNILHEYWLENEGDGVYPPNSLEAMLRVMLVPDLEYENKCAILLYFFLDLNMAIDEEVYKDVVANFIKFPSVFKLSAPLIKTVQAFWNLDHDQYLPAVDEFISPFNKNQSYPQWQVELLIEVLLNQNASNLALRILESQPSLISPLLKLNTLLANELISEAFHFVRSKNDDSLLETFFTCCLCNGQFGVIRDLALSEREGLILQNILKRSKAPGAESLHFVYLLQKSKYIEAVSYMDELANKSKGFKSSLHQTNQMETPNLVLSAFNTTMTPVTQGLTDVYFRIKNKIKKKEVDNKSPVPLSCQLIKQNANSLLGGIYHSSALSAHFATYYWGEMEEQTKQAKHLLNSNNAPFLRRPQIDTNCIDHLAQNNISYPQAYKITEKRSLVESEVLDNENDEFERQKLENKLNPKKKRRLIGQEIVDDLSLFMKMNKTSTNVSEFTFGPEQTSQTVEQTRKNSLDLLARPLLTKPVGSSQEAEEIAANAPEIHGILKTNTPEPWQQQRDQPVEEEKNLRFRLPSADVSTTQIRIEVMQSEDAVEQMDVTQEEAQKRPCSISGSPKLKQIARAVSEESNKSSISSSNQSEENFYSPLSSQNNSKLDCSNLSKYSFMSGPQPRKPLARLSAERSEKSLSPEPKTKDTELTSVNKSSNLGYTTALESSLKPRISPRRSLERVSSERLEKTDQFVRKESSNVAYVTAFETLTKPMSIASSNFKTEVTQTTSGFGSIASHATFAGSKINEFLPKVSSSKVGTVPPAKTEENKPSSPAKLSECSTVLGSLTTFECTNTGSNNVFAMPSMPMDKVKPNLDKPTEEQKRQMLETTLGMSTYDFSILDSTSLQQTKSSLMVTAKDTIEIKEAELAEDENEEIEEMECEDQDEEQNEEESSEQKKEHLIEIQKESNIDFREESNDDCIVLSSSSSSSSLTNQEEDEYANNDSEDEENSEIGENIESDDYDEDGNDEELSIDETDNPSDTENEDVIQLIEDSSSDVRQQQDNYYEESDSDDVKVVEYETTPLATDNAEKVVDKLGVVEDVENNDIISNVDKEEKSHVDEAQIEEEDDVEVVASTLEPLPAAEKSEIDAINSTQKPDTISIMSNKPAEVDIHTSETVSTTTIREEQVSVVEIQHEQQDEMMDTSIKSNVAEDIEKAVELQNKEQEKTESAEQIIEPENVSKNVEAEIVSSENVESQLSNLEKVEESTEKAELIEDEPMSLMVEDSMDGSDSKKEKPTELKLTEEEATEKQEEKSAVIKETEKSSENIEEKKEELKVKELENIAGTSVSTPRKRRTLRGSSVPPLDLEVAAVSSPRRNTRGISVPPQTIAESEEFSNLTPRTRRSVRASSLQPKYKMDDGETETPHKREKTQGPESPETNSKATRGSSVPPGAAAGKVSTRRRSVLLDAINEDPASLDSPSTRTRLRSRLNSMDSEQDSSIVSANDQLVQPKRTRRTSISNTLTELPLTPKRTRRNSISSQPETNAALTPRTLRSRSVLSVQEEDSESIPASPMASSSKRIGNKRKKSVSEDVQTESQEQIDKTSPKSEQSPVSEVSYSTSRRLTRTQLAMMEKSTALSQKLTQEAVAKEANTISPPPNKRTAKARSTRVSNAHADSDDAESVSSKVSTASSVTGTKRRVTRRSIKEKDEIDDDGASVASSVGSEKHQRPRRSKDKSSPNTTLTAIPEDAPIETKKRGRAAKN